MTDDELNIAVEEKVFGKQVRFEKHDYVPDTLFGAEGVCRNCEDTYFSWEEPDDRCERWIPSYATSPSDDYLVLKHVREWWRGRDNDKYNAFAGALLNAWYDAAGDFGLPWEEYAAFYEPGDYSRAALKALGVSIEQEVKA